MADPYATSAPDLSARPTGPPPWLAAVEDRGGTIIGPDGGFEARGGAAFAVVHCRGIGALAPFARVAAPMAVLLWIEHSAASSAPVADPLDALEASGLPIYAVKQGMVGGPVDRPGSAEVDAELIAAVLDAAGDGAVEWEQDPDFAYEVPARVAGLAGERARMLLPRLRYADHGRVYEHANLVAAKQRERAELAASVEGLDPRIERAAGWPPAPTSDAWR